MSNTGLHMVLAKGNYNISPIFRQNLKNTLLWGEQILQYYGNNTITKCYIQIAGAQFK